MAANPDFKELFAAFCAELVEFIVVGAHAVMVHTEPRYTKDLDVWVRPTIDNAQRVHRALSQFGAPLDDLTVADLATLSVEDRITNKTAVGRPQDLIDVDKLQKAQSADE